MNFRVTTLFLRLTILFFAGILLGLETNCIAQSATQSVQDTPAELTPLNDSVVSVQEIEDLAAQVSASPTLDDPQKADLKQRLERAKQALANAQSSAAKTAELKKQSTDVAQRVSETKSKLEQTQPGLPQAIGNLSPDQLASQIADLEIQLTAATSRGQELTVEPTRRQTRLSEIPNQLAKANEELESIREQQTHVAAPNESANESKARKYWLAAREAELLQSIELLNQERTSYASTAELLPLQQQLADKTVSQLRSRIDELKKIQTERKREQATDTVRSMKQLADRIPQALKELANSNVELAEFQRTLITESTQATANVTEIETAKDQVTTELATSTRRVEAVGLTDALGAMFRERRDEFQELATRFQPNLAVREKIETYQSKSFRLEDEIKTLERTLAEPDAPQVNWESDSIDWESLSEPDAKWVLLKKRRKLLGDTLQSQNTLLQSVIDSDTRRRELSSTIEKYNSFVNRRLFWTRSAPFVSVDELKQFPASVAWVAAPSNWASSVNAMGRSFKVGPLRSALVCLIAIGLIVWRSRTRRYIIEQGKLATRFDSTFRPTCMTLLASACVVALP